MTGRDRARKCSIYLRMYIVLMYHSVYIFYKQTCCYYAFPAAHTRYARRYSYSAHHPVRVLLQFSIALFLGTFFFMHFSRTHRLHLALHTCSRVCTAEYIHISKHCMCTTARENKVCARNDRTFASFICWTQRASQCRIEILTICLPASQLIIKLSFTFDFSATASSFLVSLIFDDTFTSVSSYSSFTFYKARSIFSFVLSFQICHYLCKISAVFGPSSIFYSFMSLLMSSVTFGFSFVSSLLYFMCFIFPDLLQYLKLAFKVVDFIF